MSHRQQALPELHSSVHFPAAVFGGQGGVGNDEHHCVCRKDQLIKPVLPLFCCGDIFAVEKGVVAQRQQLPVQVINEHGVGAGIGNEDPRLRFFGCRRRAGN